MTIAERAEKLVNEWTRWAAGRPMPLARAHLGKMIADALDDAEQAAYERGAQEAASSRPQIDDLVQLADQAGAEGICLVRGCKNPALIFNWEGQGFNDYLDIVDADLILLARFPRGEGGEPGIEFHAGI